MNQDMGQGMSQGMGQGMDQVGPQDAQGSDVSPFQVYEELRTTILQLVMKGLPGADQLLMAIDKIQAKNINAAISEKGGQEGVNSPKASSQYQGQ